jgi:WD40 repeat protein
VPLPELPGLQFGDPVTATVSYNANALGDGAVSPAFFHLSGPPSAMSVGLDGTTLTSVPGESELSATVENEAFAGTLDALTISDVNLAAEMSMGIQLRDEVAPFDFLTGDDLPVQIDFSKAQGSAGFIQFNLFAAPGEVASAVGFVIDTLAVSVSPLGDTGPSFANLYAVAGAGDGRLFTVDGQNNLAAIADLADPNGVAGLAFSPDGRLFGTTNQNGLPAGTTSRLIEIDPDTGAVLSDVGPLAAVVRDLAFHPQTGVLYGVTGGFGGNSTGTLVTIDTETGALTVVRDDGPDITGGGLAFAPDGTLYRGARDFSVPNGRRLEVLDPDTGAILSTVGTFDPGFVNADGSRGRDVFLDGLGVAPDGTIFGTAFLTGFYRVDPSTGLLDRVFGSESLSDIDFRPAAPWVAASGF